MACSRAPGADDQHALAHLFVVHGSAFPKESAASSVEASGRSSGAKVFAGDALEELDVAGSQLGDQLLEAAWEARPSL